MPMARHRRQPERLDRRRGAAVRGAPPARRSTPAARALTRMETFDFVIIGAGPAGEAAAYEARGRGASVAIVDRRWFGGSCPHIGCMPSKSLLHGGRRARREPGRRTRGASVGAPRLHDQPAARRRRARRLVARQAPRGRRRRSLPRRGPDRRSRPRRGPPRRRDPRDRRPERRRRGRLDLEGPAARRASTSVPSGRTARRRWPASCRGACSSSAAARPAASWPRSTPGSASRSTIVQSGDRLMPTEHPRNSETVARAPRGATASTSGSASGRPRARAGAGHGRRARHRPRRRLDRRGPRDPARRRAGRSRSTTSASSTTGSTRAAGSPFPRDGRLRIADGLWVIGDPAGPELHTHQAHYQGEMAVRMALGEPMSGPTTGRCPGRPTPIPRRPRSG